MQFSGDLEYEFSLAQLRQIAITVACGMRSIGLESGLDASTFNIEILLGDEECDGILAEEIKDLIENAYSALSVTGSTLLAPVIANDYVYATTPSVDLRSDGAILNVATSQEALMAVQASFKKLSPEFNRLAKVGKVSKYKNIELSELTSKDGSYGIQAKFGGNFPEPVLKIEASVLSPLVIENPSKTINIASSLISRFRAVSLDDGVKSSQAGIQIVDVVEKEPSNQVVSEAKTLPTWWGSF